VIRSLGTRVSRPPTQTKSVAALLAWVVVVCAAIGLGGAWIQPVVANVRGFGTNSVTTYLWGVCISNTYDSKCFTGEGGVVLGLQAASLVLSFIGAIVASVAGCLSQPKGALVASIVFQVLYFIIEIAAWAYFISGRSGYSVPWSYGFALAIVGTFLSLVVIGLSAAGLKSAPPAGAYGAGAAGYNAYGAQEPGNPAVGGQAMQKA
jgi:hypothetical protein